MLARKDHQGFFLTHAHHITFFCALFLFVVIVIIVIEVSLSVIFRLVLNAALDVP